MKLPLALVAAARQPTAHDCPQCRQLATQIDALERNLASMKSQLATLQRQAGRAAQGESPGDAPPTPEAVAAARAAEAERQRAFIAGVSQAFSQEKVDSNWAGRITSRIDTRLNSDEALRGHARDLECRERTCRVEIDDDGSGRLNDSVLRLVIGVVDALPSFAAQPIDRGDGRRSLVLYLSSQSQVAAGAR